MKTISLEYWPLERLKPYERQLRKNDRHVERMMDCITEFGFRLPILAKADGVVVDGHLRLKAALRMGLAEIPVILADGMTEAQVRAFRILANSSVAWSKWDEEALAAELDALQQESFQLELTGLALSEIEDLLDSLDREDAGPDPDKLPPDGPCVTMPGDIWLLGAHRLLCGDSTCKDAMANLMQGAEADLIWTDPPYNVNYKGKAGSIKNDNMKAAEFRQFLLAAYSAMFGVLGKGCPIYVAHADTEGVNFRGAFQEAGFKLASCLIWRKDHFVLGRADYQCQHEPILYGWKPGSAHRWYGGRKRKTIQELGSFGSIEQLADGSIILCHEGTSTVITGRDLAVEQFDSTIILERKPLRSELHPTMKPVGLVERFIRNSSRAGNMVLDPFGGSGTTLIACERTNRTCRTMELDPKYADAIVRRWQAYTGKSAVHERTGSTFDDREQLNG
jgi:DNA modification methylase